jgi:tetratricopeptide (TPR) repeat protein
MSNELQQRIEDLRRKIRRASEDDIPNLEGEARRLLTDAKNTPHEANAQALFAELARVGSPASPHAATVRGLLRRARIRIEIAGDDDDIDEAIDILSEAVALDPQDPDVIDLLQQAAARNSLAAQRVHDLFQRYNVAADVIAPAPAAPAPAQEDDEAPATQYPTSSGYPAPEEHIYQDAPPGRRMPGQGPLYNGPDIDETLSELTQAYYAGDYQLTVDYANRILAQQPGNPTALEYRQKAEDNLIRGVVPDHRIPFDARVAFNRANSLVRAGNYDEAERLYREARELAERSGIMSWKDAEQAMLDIQDLALARELLNEGDRLMTTDNWSEALRKYEGALRVVANDPQTEERIEMVRRVQQEADQAGVQLGMLSGSLQEQANQLQSILGILTRARQRLPNSERLSQLLREANQRLNGIKTQLHDQAQAGLNRAQSATALDERLGLTNEALNLLEVGIKLDPGDTALSDTLLGARAAASDMERARQIIDRAAALIAQNFDNELSQARSMLVGLDDYAQDPRYRTVVSDLLSRYIERAEIATEEGDLAEAESWLDATKGEPFNVLGRRAEISRLDSNVRNQRRNKRLQWLTIAFIIFIFGIAGIALSQPLWYPIVYPPPTATPTETPLPTDTPLPSETPLPTDTPLPTETYTPTLTPSETVTPSPTITPSFTVTASLTPTHTDTPTHTPTITPTLTPTDTPTITPTRDILCQVFIPGPESINIRAMPSLSASRVGQIPATTIVDVLGQEIGAQDSRVWYLISGSFGSGASVTGWLRSDTVRPVVECPSLNP